MATHAPGPQLPVVSSTPEAAPLMAGSASIATTAHPKKNWLARIFIIVLSVIWILAALGLIITTSSMLANTDKILSNSTQETIAEDALIASGNSGFSFRTLNIVVLSISCFIVVVSALGIVGAATRQNVVLNIYTGLVALSVMGTFAAALYFDVILLQRRADWSKLDPQTWASWYDYDKDYYQWVFKCCGFDKNDMLAYTGSVRYWDGEPDQNQCGPFNPYDLPGCHDASMTFYMYRLIGVSVGAFVFLIMLFLAMASAHHSKTPHAPKSSHRQSMSSVASARVPPPKHQSFQSVYSENNRPISMSSTTGLLDKSHEQFTYQSPYHSGVSATYTSAPTHLSADPQFQNGMYDHHHAPH